ncbi:AbfB domain-containing protein [Embleya sp. MST-111070]|uniref:AbfB domain-containing protein n=1 Tax=Embleya sp. MST-111070 TaxID=3398231 RepID=UPI003F7402B7
MSLSASDLAKAEGTPITVRSTFFQNIYLRMDGTGVTTSTDNGGGKVNCQYGTGTWTTYKVHAQSDGTYSFESAAFPNVFLRLDGTGVPATMAGGGKVNCQFGAGPYEKFKARAQADGSFSLESAAFPGIYLRLVTDSGVTSATGPGGTVNAQINANGGDHEKFFLDLA